MSREVTNSEGLLGGVIIALLVLVVLMSGCATHHPAKEYKVESFTLILMDQHDIRAKYRRDYGKDTPGLSGYCDQKARVIFCDYNEEGTGPNFEHLGHELWHLNELGGRFHP